MARLIGSFTAAVILLAAAFPAHALLTVTVTDNGTTVTMTPGTDSNTGNLVSTGSDTSFSTISVNSAGFPIEPAPDLATTVLKVSTATGFTGTHVLAVTVTQTAPNGAFAGGPAAATFTFNGLIGGPFTTATEDQLYNGGVISTHTVTNLNGVANFGPDPTTVGAYVSDAQRFSTTFTTGSQTFEGTIQFLSTAMAVPEPNVLASFGVALLTVSWFYRRKRNGDGG
jgi:hypothetical protein